MRNFRTVQQIRQDKIEHNRKQDLWFEEIIKRMEAGIPYSDCINFKN